MTTPLEPQTNPIDSSPPTLKQHKARHSRQKQHTSKRCPQCKYKHKKLDQLILHLRSAHGLKEAEARLVWRREKEKVGAEWERGLRMGTADIALGSTTSSMQHAGRSTTSPTPQPCNDESTSLHTKRAISPSSGSHVAEIDTIGIYTHDEYTMEDEREHEQLLAAGREQEFPPVSTDCLLPSYPYPSSLILTPTSQHTSLASSVHEGDDDDSMPTTTTTPASTQDYASEHENPEDSSTSSEYSEPNIVANEELDGDLDLNRYFQPHNQGEMRVAFQSNECLYDASLAYLLSLKPAEFGSV